MAEPEYIEVTVTEEPIERLPELAAIPSRFHVHAILEVHLEGDGLDGMRLEERELDAPYEKDYDAVADGPARWASRFDVSSWGLLSAHREGERLGAAVVAWKTPTLQLLAGRDDLALLWDLRVHPDLRRRGIAAALFGEVERWARRRGCTHLAVETQNVNVPACRFYQRRGCSLGAIDRFAYPELPGETQLIWYKELGTAPNRGGAL